MSSGRSERTGAMVGTANQLPEPGEKLAAETEFIADEVGISRSAQREFRLRHQHFQRAGVGVEADHVAVADLGDRPAVDRFGRHMDRRRHLAGGAGHAAVGHQRHA